jgi:hypothetical protein
MVPPLPRHYWQNRKYEHRQPIRNHHPASVSPHHEVARWCGPDVWLPPNFESPVIERFSRPECLLPSLDLRRVETPRLNHRTLNRYFSIVVERQPHRPVSAASRHSPQAAPPRPQMNDPAITMNACRPDNADAKKQRQRDRSQRAEEPSPQAPHRPQLYRTSIDHDASGRFSIHGVFLRAAQNDFVNHARDGRWPHR